MGRERDLFQNAFRPLMEALERGEDWGSVTKIGIRCTTNFRRAKGFGLTEDEKAAMCPYEVESRQSLSVVTED